MIGYLGEELYSYAPRREPTRSTRFLDTDLEGEYSNATEKRPTRSTRFYDLFNSKEEQILLYSATAQLHSGRPCTAKVKVYGTMRSGRKNELKTIEVILNGLGKNKARSKITHRIKTMYSAGATPIAIEFY